MKDKLSLFENTNLYWELIQLVEEGELDDHEEADRYYELLAEDHDNIIIETVKTCLEEEIRADGIISFAKTTLERGKALKKRIERKKSFVAWQQRHDVDCEFGTITRRKSQFVDIPNPLNIPTDFLNKTVKETVAPDKSKIKEALKSGEEVQGCLLKDNYTLRIK